MVGNVGGHRNSSRWDTGCKDLKQEYGKKQYLTGPGVWQQWGVDGR